MVYNDCKDPMLDIKESRSTAPDFAYTGMVRRERDWNIGNSGTEDSGTEGQRRQVLNMLRSNFNYCYFQKRLFCYFAGQYWLKDHQLIVFK